MMQRRKLRLREIKPLAQDHTASKAEVKTKSQASRGPEPVLSRDPTQPPLPNSEGVLQGQPRYSLLTPSVCPFGGCVFSPWAIAKDSLPPQPPTAVRVTSKTQSRSHSYPLLGTLPQVLVT